MLARDRLAFAAWGSPLALEQFLEREIGLRDTSWSQGNLRSWVLVEGGAIVASCETYRMGCRTPKGSGVAFGIASVFVEDALRGRGHAERMMHEVVRVMRDEGAAASILFSEVRPALYARAGWVAVEARTAAWRAAPREASAAARLDATALPRLLEVASKRPLAFQVLPTPEQIDWHLARARIYARLLQRDAPEVVALEAGGAWAILFASFRSERLILLDLEPGTPEETREVIEAARGEAARLGLREVTIIENAYNREALHRAEGERRECDEGIPMIAPLAPEVRAEDWRDVVRAVWV